MLAAGELSLLDAEGAALSPWQLRELEHQTDSWHADTHHCLAITAAGLAGSEAKTVALTAPAQSDSAISTR